MGDQAKVLRTETIPMGSVRPHPQNARKGNAQRIEKSLRAHGQYKPIIVHEESGHILVGNNTWRIAHEKLGWDKIQATFVSCSDAQALEILAVDNRTSDGATYDNEALLALLDSISQSGGTLLAAGFSSEDRDDLAALLEEVPKVDIPRQGYLDGGDRTEPSMGDRSETYSSATMRSVVVSLDGQQYVDFAAALDRIAPHFGTESNTETIVAAVHRVDAELNGEPGEQG